MEVSEELSSVLLQVPSLTSPRPRQAPSTTPEELQPGAGQLQPKGELGLNCMVVAKNLN